MNKKHENTHENGNKISKKNDVFNPYQKPLTIMLKVWCFRPGSWPSSMLGLLRGLGVLLMDYIYDKDLIFMF